MLRNVDLPQPVWPTIATMSPWRIVKSRRSIATTGLAVPVWRKTFRSPATSIAPAPFMRATVRYAPHARQDGLREEEDHDQDEGPGEDLGHENSSWATTRP